jgi:hypothetical protein
MKRSTSIQLLSIVSIILLASCNRIDMFTPGEIWPDTDGVHINAHGGGILFHDGTYYWFGEHKVEGKAGNQARVGIACYSSRDLYNWRNEGIVLPVSQDTTSLITSGCIIERPKVIFNEKSGRFVMWFHHELKGMGYKAAMTGLAVSDKVTGPYEYVRSLRPNAGQWPVNIPDTSREAFLDFAEMEWWSPEWKQAVDQGALVSRDFEGGQMARDMTLFVDDDGTAYHIHSSEENQTLHISELSEEYTEFTGKYVRVQPGKSNEAPAIFKRKGKYFMIASGCTGWKPNAARLLSADSIMGEWTYHGNPAKGENREITYGAQSTYILEVRDKPGSYFFMADIWRPENAIDGRYLWLPLCFDEDGLPYLEYFSHWEY